MKSNKLLGMQTLLRELTGQHLFLAGGCVRDTLYGVKPKDYDAIVCDEGWDEADVFDIMTKISNRLAQVEVKTEVYQAYESCQGNLDSFQAMFRGCMKIHIYNVEVDLLFSVHRDIDVHVSHHDCNLNQVYLDDEGQIIGDRVSELEFVDGIAPDRIAYMTHKFATLSALGFADE